MRALLHCLKSKYNSKIIRLNLSSCSLNHKALVLIFPVLTKNTSLKVLLLDQNDFEEDYFFIMKDSLRMNGTLLKLSLS